MAATNQINDEQIKIIIVKANSKTIVKRGRPHKYHTEEERRVAINQQLKIFINRHHLCHFIHQINRLHSLLALNNSKHTN